MIDPRQGPLTPPGTIDAEIDAIQLKTGMTRAAIFAAINRVGHDRRAILADLKGNDGSVGRNEL